MPCPVPAAETVAQNFQQRVNLQALRVLFANKDKILDSKGETDSASISVINELHTSMIQKKKSVISIPYNVSKKYNGWGRVYGNKGSLEWASRRVRGYLCEGLYHDVDIVNCHAVLMVQYAKRYLEMEMPEMEKYNADRDTYLATINEDRDAAKAEMCKIWYGDFVPSGVLAPIAHEVKNLKTALTQVTELKPFLALIRDKKEKNAVGSFFAQIMQTEERTVLNAMIKSFKAKGWNIGTLMYDGHHIDERKGMEVPLKQVADDVFDETGYRIELKIKPFETLDTSDFAPIEDMEALEASEATIPISGAHVKKAEYLKAKEEFEKHHFYFSSNNTVVRFRDNEMEMYGVDHAKIAFGNTFRIDLPDRESIQLMAYWLADPTRRTYRKMSYTKDGDDTFVRPLSFVYEKHTPPAEEEAKKILTKFDELMDHVCNRKPELKTYLTNWFAHMVQKPTENAQTAIIMTGEQGTGKDTIGGILGKYVIGEQFFKDYTSSEQFWDSHDCGTEGKVFVKLQEAVGYLAHQNNGRFKARITAPTESYNPKGLKAYEVTNLAHYFVTTNEDCPVKMEETDRRFVLIRTGSYQRGVTTFWDDVRKELETYKAGAVIGQYLKGIDLTGFRTTAIPRSEFRDHMIEVARDPLEGFVTSWTGENTKAADLYTSYRIHCGENAHAPVSFQLWGRKMGVMMDAGKVVKTRTEHGIHYCKS
jgi:YHS domain-containing protein